MDNKKWYSRFGTIFWWSLAILPLIFALIYFIGYHFTFNSGITSANELSNYHQLQNGNFSFILEDILFNSEPFSFFELQLPFLNTMYYNLFTQLDVNYAVALASLFGWMTSVAFYHLIFDFMVWLPRFFHNILEKGVGKLEGK